MILICAAEFEALPTHKKLLAQGLNADILPFGIGALESAKMARELQELVRDKVTVYLGSCGTFGDFLEPHLVTTHHVSWLPTSYRTGQAYGVKGSDDDITWTPSDESSPDLPSKRVLCSPGISTSAVLPEGFRKEEYVENLELYSVAQEVASSSKEFHVILGVTNAIGPNAHEQWKANYQKVAEMTADYCGGRFHAVDH